MLSLKTTLLLAFLGVLLLSQAAFALTSITDCDIGQCGAPGCQITTLSETYQLSNSIATSGAGGETCLTMAAPQTTIDGNGFAITASGLSDIGIFMQQPQQFVENASIIATNSGTGISTSSGSTQTAYHNKITANVWINDGNPPGTDVFDNGTAGNEYHFANGSGAWTTYNITCTPLVCPWANGGSDLPFSLALVGGEWIGEGQDKHPFTSNALTFQYSITWLPQMSAPNQNVPCTGWFSFWYNISLSDNSTFNNVTCYRNFTDGTIADAATSSDINSQFINTTYTQGNYPNGSCSVDYDVHCVLDTANGQNTTTTRRISILNYIPVPTNGGGDMGGIIFALTITWIFFELLAIWLFMPKTSFDENGKPIKTNHPVFAYASYMTGLFFFMMFLFAAIDDSSTTNPTTANVLQTFITPVTMLLFASLALFMIYIFLNALIKSMRVVGIKVGNWWFDGKW